MDDIYFCSFVHRLLGGESCCTLCHEDHLEYDYDLCCIQTKKRTFYLCCSKHIEFKEYLDDNNIESW